MLSNSFGSKLHALRKLREPLGEKGVRQSIVVKNNPISIDANHNLLVSFPNLGAHDVIGPGVAE